MKSLILIALAAAQIHAQNATFPLHTGDRWQYTYLPPPAAPPPGPSVRVVGDTVMSGSGTFAILLGDGGISTQYMREQGDSVFVYSPFLKHDYLYLDFARHPGDTVSSIAMGSDTMDIVLQSVSSTSTYGGLLREWWFAVNPWRHAIDVEYSIGVVDSVGMVSMHPSFGDMYSLAGAVIGGRTYGVIAGVSPAERFQPGQFELSQNYPNPFNPSTSISYGLPGRSLVTLTVHNTLGQRVATLVNETQEAGPHEVRFDGSGLASGIYFYRLSAGRYGETKRMLLIR